eukprot:RCo054476
MSLVQSVRSHTADIPCTEPQSSARLNASTAYCVDCHSPRATGRSLASTALLGENPVKAWSKGGFRVPLKLVIVVSLCVFTVGPAIALWMASWRTGNEGINSVNSMGQSSLQSVTVELRNSTMQSTQSAFWALVQPAEDLVLALAYVLKGSGRAAMTASAAVGNYSATLGVLGLHFFLRASLHLQALEYTLLSPPSLPRYAGMTLTQFTVYGRLNIDLLHNNTNPTIYNSENLANRYGNGTVIQIYAVDQDTGGRLFPLRVMSYPLNVGTQPIPTQESFSWTNELFFEQNIGLAEVPLSCQVPTADHLAAHRLTMYTSVFTVSSFLRGLLSGPKQRLFAFFRTPAGTLIGASHGKFFSHSDVDFSQSNPF